MGAVHSYICNFPKLSGAVCVRFLLTLHASIQMEKNALSNVISELCLFFK